MSCAADTCNGPSYWAGVTTLGQWKRWAVCSVMVFYALLENAMQDAVFVQVFVRNVFRLAWINCC